MHSLLIATINKERADDSSKARKYVYNFLADCHKPVVLDGCNYGSYVSYKDVLCLVDWLVIGGRWSGHLVSLTGQLWDVLEEEGLAWTWGELIKSEGHEPTGPGIDDLVLKNKDDHGIQQVWEKLGGTGVHPLQHLPSEGQEHDAMLVTEELYEKHLKDYEGGNKYSMRTYPQVMPDFADLEEDVVTRAFIGQKWIVVVDCHS